MTKEPNKAYKIKIESVMVASKSKIQSFENDD